MVPVLAILTAAGCQPADGSAPDQTDVELVEAQGPFVCLPRTETGYFPDGYQTAFENLEQGLVGRFSHFAGETSGTDWQVFECSSGQMAAIQIRRGYAGEVDLATGAVTQKPEVNHKGRFNEFYMAIRAKSDVRFGEYTRAAKEAGLTVDVSERDYEVCGCYAAYPELRGAKTPFTEGNTPSIYEVIQ